MSWRYGESTNEGAYSICALKGADTCTCRSRLGIHKSTTPDTVLTRVREGPRDVDHSTLHFSITLTDFPLNVASYSELPSKL